MRFVSPETEHIDLADGPDGEKNWIEIKKRLNKGEDSAYRAAAGEWVEKDDADDDEMPGAQVEGDGKKPKRRMRLKIDMTLLPFTKVQAYLVDWSAKRPDDKGVPQPVKITLDALKQMEVEDFDEIAKAIDAYLAQRDAQKKVPSGSAKPTPPTP